MSSESPSEAGGDEPMIGDTMDDHQAAAEEEQDSGYGTHSSGTGDMERASSSLSNVSMSTDRTDTSMSLNSSQNASRSATPTNESVEAAAEAEAPDVLSDPRNFTLYKTALSDVKSGRLSNQLYMNESSPTDAEWIRARDASLRSRASELLAPLSRSGAAPSAKEARDIQDTVNEYYCLLRWLGQGETLASKRLNIDVRANNGSLHSVACDLAGNVGDLQTAVATRLGPGCGRQLLCNAEPMSNPAQGMYELAARHGLGLRRGTVVQEVARTNGG